MGCSPSRWRGRMFVSDSPDLSATAEALAPSAPVPALAARPVFAPPRAPRAPSRDLRPTAGAPAVTVPLLAEPPTPPSVLALAPPGLAGARAPDVAVLSPSVRPRVRFVYSLVAFA